MISARFPVALLPKVSIGQRDGLRNICAAFGNCFCVEIVDRFGDRVVIDRQRRLHKRAAGKRDQTDAIALQLVDQILGREFDALEPVRLHVVGKHAARSIDREKEIEPFALHILKRVTPARLGQSDDGQGEAKKEKAKRKTRRKRFTVPASCGSKRAEANSCKRLAPRRSA